MLLLAVVLTSAKPVHAQEDCAASTVSAPFPGAGVQGLAEITGSASIDRFNFYKLEWARAGDPEQWIAVSDVVSSAVRNDRLDTWDVRALEDGAYRLKLTVVDQDHGERCRFVVEDVQVANEVAALGTASAPPMLPTAEASAPASTEAPETLRVGATEPPSAVATSSDEGAAAASSTPPSVVEAPSATTDASGSQDLDAAEPPADEGPPDADQDTPATSEPVVPRDTSPPRETWAGMGRRFAVGILLALAAGLALLILLVRR